MEWADGSVGLGDVGCGGGASPGVDPGSEFEFHPSVDVGGDGVADTMVLRGALGSGEDGMIVAADLDGDGLADRVTTIEDDGDFVAWEPGAAAGIGDVAWTVVDRGSL
ncbi:DUF6802 family protein [Rhodococcoides corynebacterioides]|nr:DUF6802 family protein [Rhodococcus corynebacterioides]